MKQKEECQEYKIQISELQRILEIEKEKYQQISEELSVQKNSFSLFKKENIQKKERVLKAYKSVFGALKAEISCIKAAVRSEIDTSEKLFRNNFDALLMKYNE